MAADGDVEALLHQIDEAVGDVQLDAQLRIPPRQHGQAIRELKLRNGNRCRDPHGAAWLRQPPMHHRFGGLRLDHHRAGVVVHVASDVGQREAARCAVQQLNAKRCFQRRNPFADRGL